MRTIAVTGATGFIGNELVTSLLEDPENHVVAIIRDPASLKHVSWQLKDNLSVIECSLEHIAQLPLILNGQVDTFYHLAWAGIRASDRDDVHLQQANRQYSMDAIRSAAKLGVTVFIGIGSQAEYGLCSGKIDETYPPYPVSEYGKAKLQVYEEGKVLSEKLGLKFIWARIFSTYGVGDNESTLIPSVLKKMLRNEPILLSDCTQTWDFVHVKDVVQALILLQNAPLGIYNISGINPQKLMKYIYEMVEYTHSSSYLDFGAFPHATNGFDPISKKLQETVGWYPRISFREGILEIIKDLRENGA